MHKKKQKTQHLNQILMSFLFNLNNYSYHFPPLHLDGHIFDLLHC